MKILLIYPFGIHDSEEEKSDRRFMPVGLYYIGATLKAAGYDVEILNWIGRLFDEDSWRKELAAAQPDVIGFSVLTFNRWGALQIAAAAKQINPSTVIVFGGIGATYLWRLFLKYFEQVDYVILYEGEIRLLNLLRFLENPRTPYPENIDGLAFRKDGAPFCVEAEDFIDDLDTLADPALYFDMPVVLHGRGCPYHCAFCASPYFWKRRVRSHSPEYFVRQLERLKARGVNSIYIADDTLTFDKLNIIKICRRIIEKKLDVAWLANSRVDHIDADVLYWMRMAGCGQISFGVESGSPEIRKFYGKKFSNDQIVRAFRLTSSYGILARAYYIIGASGECWDTVFQTMDIMRRSKPMKVVVYDLAVCPPSELYDKYINEQGLGDEIWLKLDEFIPYTSVDSPLTQNMLLVFRNALMNTYYQFVAEFADCIELVDIPELYPRHAEYLAKMGDIFEDGFHSEIKAIRAMLVTAEKLYRRSLEYFPLERAYLGLVTIQQRNLDFEGSVQTARQGLARFPCSSRLAFRLSLGLHFLDRSDEALDYLVSFHASKKMAESAARQQPSIARR